MDTHSSLSLDGGGELYKDVTTLDVVAAARPVETESFVLSVLLSFLHSFFLSFFLSKRLLNGTNRET